jgi:hypothetical protein
MTRYYFTRMLRLMQITTATAVINATGIAAGVVYCLLLILDIQDKMSYSPSPIQGDLHYLNARHPGKASASQQPAASAFIIPPGYEEVYGNEAIGCANATDGPSCLPAKYLPAPKHARVVIDSIFIEPKYNCNSENPKKALV